MKDKAYLPTPEFDTDDLSPEEYSTQIKRKTIALIGAGIACSVFSYAIFTNSTGSISTDNNGVTAKQTKRPTPETEQKLNRSNQSISTATKANASDNGHQPSNPAKHLPVTVDGDASPTPNAVHSDQSPNKPSPIGNDDNRDPLNIFHASSNVVASATPSYEKNPSPSSDIHNKPSKTTVVQKENPQQNTPTCDLACEATRSTKNKLTEILRDLTN
ncbi:hypothetical protein [Laceyella sacchari]|uniref:Uncharacterized protein n=1 Tax=Laceyella sacchari TaxID=37482 RepID=A0ABY5U0C5_LACSH|nr:hypothetical protein [Laceyella sacchari]TCW37984.1 hypothetical protein EDC32_103659 [Laceyella sacchari]UWE03104.1 hypothetical protein NYR52_13390 [Laceyella sacchari]